MAFIAPALPVLGAIAGVAGAGIDAFGKYQSGQYAGQVAENNAHVAGQNAEYATEAGTADAGTQSLKGAVKSAGIKNAIAADGIDVNTGSAPKVLASQAEANQLDIETILHNSDLTAYGYRTQQSDLTDEAKQDRAGGVLGAIGSGLKGVSTLVDKAPSLPLKWGTGGAATKWGWSDLS